MDEGQHVGDHLDDRRRADGPHVEELVADGLKGGGMEIEYILAAAGQHGDLAARRQMHAAGDRGFQRADAADFGQSRQPLHLVAAIGGILDPCAAGFQSIENLRQHLLRNGGRRQAGEDVIDLRGQFLWRRRPGGTRLDVTRSELLVDIVDGDLEALGNQAHGDMTAEIAEADVAVVHVILPPCWSSRGATGRRYRDAPAPPLR